MKSHVLFAAVAAITATSVIVPTATLAASPDPHRFAVAGVKLEMTVDEVQSALNSYDPALQIELRNVKSADGTTDLYLNAIKPDAAFPRHYSEEVAVAFTRSVPHRAFAVTHDLGLPPGHERAFPDVVKQITETFGPGAKTTGGFHDWVFDAAGTPIDGTPNPQTAETPETFLACWHGVFENTTSLFRFNFGTMAPNGLPISFHPACGVSVRIVVETYDPAHPTAVQEIVERLMSDTLAVADGRSTQTPEAPEQLLKRINPHGPDIPNAKTTDSSGQL
jgi:hypothetical protein